MTRATSAQVQQGLWRPPMIRRSPTEIVLYMATQMRLPTAREIARYVSENLPVVHTLEGDAIEQALRIAPEPDLPAVRMALLADANETGMDVARISRYMPDHVSHVAKLLFYDLRITETTSRDKRVHRLFQASSVQVDAVMLPTDVDDPHGYQLRLITEESLLGRFEILDTIDVSPRSRDRQP